MTPTGRNAVIVGAVAVVVSGTALVAGFLFLDSHPSARRHHDRRAEGARGPTTLVDRLFQPKPSPKPVPTHSSNAVTIRGAPSAGRSGPVPPARPENAAAPGPDFLLAEVTPERTAAEKAVQEKLEGAVFRNPGNEVEFVDCAEKPCRARAEAKDLETLTAFLRDVSGSYDGHLSVDLRERLDPFMGRSFQADLLVGTNDTQPVPTQPFGRE